MLCTLPLALYREETINLRAEQDRDYREAEEADRRERQRREQEREAQQRAEHEAKQLEEEKEAIELSNKLHYESIIKRKQAQIKPEPAQSPDAATIRFQLPQASKLTRRFHRTDTVENLFDFLLVHFHTSGCGVRSISLSTHSKQELADPAATIESVVSISPVTIMTFSLLIINYFSSFIFLLCRAFILVACCMSQILMLSDTW